MALTRAQLLMGNSSLGAVLTGQVQAVKQGPGIKIQADGTIEIDSQSVVGLMKLGQTAALAAGAYNGYNWPSSTGAVGEQLTITSIAGGVTTLDWEDPDGIPWTQKGQLVVGTGAGSGAQTLLNVGTNGQILIADSGTTSGLNYTSNYVSTTGPTGAANMPAGDVLARPSSPSAGATRYNTVSTSLEFWNGGGWETVASSSTNAFVEKTSDTGAAIIPSGTTGQQPGSPLGGYFRFNDDTDKMEFWNGASWQSLASSTSGSFVDKTVPVTGTPSAVIPVGTTAQQQSSPLAGYLRFNDDTDLPEIYTGTGWATIPASIGGSFVPQTIPTTGGPSAVLPSGTTGTRQTAPAPLVGYTRVNTTLNTIEFHNGTGWVPLVSSDTTTSVGLGLALSGVSGNTVKVSLPSAATPPAVGTGTAQAIDGSVYFDNEYGSFFYRYVGASSTSWVQALGSNTDGGALDFPAGPVGGATYPAPNGITYTFDGTKGVWTQGAGGSALTAASLAEAAAGTINTKYSSPETAVPKNAAGMTGAAILPGGTTGQQPGGAADGWFRYNSTLKVLEYYVNSAWLPIVAGSGTTGGVSVQTAAAAPTTRANGTALQAGDLYYNTATQQYFSWNGTSWVSFDQRNVQVKGAAYTAKANDYVVVTTAGVTITLPATPIAGTVVTVVVAGTFLDTTVARNGSNIMGIGQDLVLDKQYAAMQFTYTDATNGWRLN